jgi:hypothetical protein
MTRYLRERRLYGPQIDRPASADLGIVVVIPAKDEPALIRSLESLLACDRPAVDVEVIVVVNTGERDTPELVAENQQIAAEAATWAARTSTPGLRFDILQMHGLPKKHAGVGLARKIGMDEACHRLESIGNSAGVIACFDADSTCSQNYLVEIESLFREVGDLQACAIRFEHPLDGDEFPAEIYEAITLYELHLRYFVEAQRHAGFPFASHTIGSSMAVRCSAYQDQNGMNRRQAGEDFYFLHKFTPLGQVAELQSACVIPSPRPSHRVPFGTGKAIDAMIGSPDGELNYTTYAPQSFEDLRRFFGMIDELFPAAVDREAYFERLPQTVKGFFDGKDFWSRIDEMRANATSPATFRLRFYKWFNAFAIMKFLHLARDGGNQDIDVCEAARWLLQERHGDGGNGDARGLLERFREIQRPAVLWPC